MTLSKEEGDALIKAFEIGDRNFRLISQSIEAMAAVINELSERLRELEEYVAERETENASTQGGEAP
mgnify:CR=1 FL=1